MTRDGFTLAWLAERDARLARAYGSRAAKASVRESARIVRAAGGGISPRSSPSAPQRMNGLEREYAALLELRVRAGEVLWWAFEPLRLRLAAGAWFTPDFAVVVAPECRLELHETKGFMREAARVRLRVAAGTYPWRFVLVRRERGARAGLAGWRFEEVPG